MLRSGAPRRIAHLTRWSTAVVFTLAVAWLGRLSTRERLVLATRAVGASARMSVAGRAPADAFPAPTVWTEVTAMLWQAELLQNALTHRVVDGAGRVLDLEELREPGVDLAAAMKEAGALLKQLHAQDDPEQSDVERMALAEVVGSRRRHLSLTELRQARDLGLVQDFTADMDHRAAAAANVLVAAGPRQWTVHWEPTGRFRADAYGGAGNGTGTATAVVNGWAAHPAAVADELTWWSTPPHQANPSWWGDPPPTQLS